MRRGCEGSIERLSGESEPCSFDDDRWAAGCMHVFITWDESRARSEGSWRAMWFGAVRLTTTID